MELALAFIGVPAATFLGLAAISRGRPALIGCVVALLLTAILFVAGDGSADSYWLALVMLIGSAIVLAAVVQVLRMMIGPDRPGWVYPLIVGLALMVAGVPMLSILGV